MYISFSLYAYMYHVIWGKLLKWNSTKLSTNYANSFSKCKLAHTHTTGVVVLIFISSCYRSFNYNKPSIYWLKYLFKTYIVGYHTFIHVTSTLDYAPYNQSTESTCTHCQIFSVVLDIIVFHLPLVELYT